MVGQTGTALGGMDLKTKNYCRLRVHGQPALKLQTTKPNHQSEGSLYISAGRLLMFWGRKQMEEWKQ